LTAIPSSDPCVTGYCSASSFCADRCSIQFLRDIMLFFGVKFKITQAPKEVDEEGVEVTTAERQAGTGEVMVSCVGVGYSNVNKAMA
jgi:RNA 3'-terminal phosphate cyclase-like protein